MWPTAKPANPEWSQTACIHIQKPKANLMKTYRLALLLLPFLVVVNSCKKDEKKPEADSLARLPHGGRRDGEERDAYRQGGRRSRAGDRGNGGRA